MQAKQHKASDATLPIQGISPEGDPGQPANPEKSPYGLRKAALMSLALPGSGPLASTGFIGAVVFSGAGSPRECVQQYTGNFSKLWRNATPTITGRLALASTRNVPVAIGLDEGLGKLELAAMMTATEQVAAPMEFREVGKTLEANGIKPLEPAEKRKAFGRFNVMAAAKNLGPNLAMAFTTKRASENASKAPEEQAPLIEAMALGYRDGFAGTFLPAVTQTSLNQSAQGYTFGEMAKHLGKAFTCPETAAKRVACMAFKAHAVGAIGAVTAAVLHSVPQSWITDPSCAEVKVESGKSR